MLEKVERTDVGEEESVGAGGGGGEKGKVGLRASERELLGKWGEVEDMLAGTVGRLDGVVVCLSGFGMGLN